MNSTDILQLMGILYFIIGLGFIFNKKYYYKTFSEMIDSKTYMFFGGFLAFIIGFILITFYNECSLSKDGLVAIIGRISLIKGILLILFPKDMAKINSYFVNKSYILPMGFLISILGLGIMYLGFVY